jgi:[acyl-carrier-protein] S-malonyltransferase
MQGRVVSGHADALDIVSASAAGLGALKVARLAVSGAFHTRLMAPARAALMEVRRRFAFHIGWVMCCQAFIQCVASIYM